MQSSPEIISMRTFYFLAVIPVLLGSCSLTKKEAKIDVSDVVIPETDHEYFEVEHMFINYSDIFNENKEVYYVYIYSLTCNHCQELKNWIIETALKRDDIFFLKGSNNDVITTDVSNTIGISNTKDLSILGYPTLLKISNKILVQNVAGNSQIKGLLN